MTKSTLPTAISAVLNGFKMPKNKNAPYLRQFLLSFFLKLLDT